MSDFPLEYIRDDDIVFDIGSCDGNDSIQFANICKYVVAFEASNDNWIKLCANVLKYPNILPVHAAVSHVDGHVDFRDSYGLNSCSGSILEPSERQFIVHPTMGFSEPYQVPSVTLDKFIECNKIIPTILHIDAQGAEYYVLNHITYCKPRIVWAEHSERDNYKNTYNNRVDDLMVSRGYKYIKFKCDMLYQYGT